MLRLAREAEHARSRERFMALYQVGSGKYNATQWAKESGREDETVLRKCFKRHKGVEIGGEIR